MTTPKPQVIVLGDVITDIITHQLEFLAKASDTRTRIDIRCGGSAANMATWLATVGITVHFVGRVGQDTFGAYHAAELHRYGVIPHFGYDPQLSTGTVIALIEPDGERHMLTDRGANQNLELADIPWELFKPNRCFHLSGYSLQEEQGRAVSLAALAKARHEQMQISIDPSSTALLQALSPQKFLEWTQGAHLCFPNLAEGRLLSGETSPAAVLEFLCDYYGEVVLKLGVEGAIWGKRGQPVISVSALPVEVVDSTGAGDAFCAGFLSERLRGNTPYEALLTGTQFGAKVTAQIGARPLKIH